MQTDKAGNTATHARSKLEFLYRELLIEVERLQNQNSDLAQELRQISISISGAPQALHKATSRAVAQATEGTEQHLQLARLALSNAQRDLHRTGETLLAASTRNGLYIGLIAGGCGLAGAVIGVLIGAWFLAG